MTYLGNFDQKCYIWVFLGHNFKRSIGIFEISTLKFAKNFYEKTKMSKFVTKNA